MRAENKAITLSSCLVRKRLKLKFDHSLARRANDSRKAGLFRDGYVQAASSQQCPHPDRHWPGQQQAVHQIEQPTKSWQQDRSVFGTDIALDE